MIGSTASRHMSTRRRGSSPHVLKHPYTFSAIPQPPSQQRKSKKLKQEEDDSKDDDDGGGGERDKKNGDSDGKVERNCQGTKRKSSLIVSSDGSSGEGTNEHAGRPQPEVVEEVEDGTSVDDEVGSKEKDSPKAKTGSGNYSDSGSDMNNSDGDERRRAAMSRPSLADLYQIPTNVRMKRRRAVTQSDYKTCALVQSKLKFGDIA